MRHDVYRVLKGNHIGYLMQHKSGRTENARGSLRLPGYDYAQAGAYFVTVCTRNRECLFGTIVNGEMRLNAVGEIVHSVWSAPTDRRCTQRNTPDYTSPYGKVSVPSISNCVIPNPGVKSAFRRRVATVPVVSNVPLAPTNRPVPPIKLPVF